MSIFDRLRRALGGDPDAPERLPSPDELTLLTRAQGEPEALMLQEMLREHGIHALVRSRDWLGPAYGAPGIAGHELLVARRDLRRARELLEAPPEP